MRSHITKNTFRQFFISTLVFSFLGYSIALKDPTEGKSPKEVQQILQNLDALSEDDLVAFGSSNPPACKAIKTDHLAKGNPFRYILIDHDCLGGENLEFLAKRIGQDKSCAVRAIQRNRDFWCPRIERTNLGMSAEKEKILRDGGCPGYSKNNSNNSSDNIKSKPADKDPPPAQKPKNGKRPNQRRRNNPPRPSSSNDSKASRVNFWLIMAIVLLVVIIICLAIAFAVRRHRRKKAKAAAHSTNLDEGAHVAFSQPINTSNLYPPVPPLMEGGFSNPPPAYHSLEIHGTSAALAGPSAPPPLIYPGLTDVDSKN